MRINILLLLLSGCLLAANVTYQYDDAGRLLSATYDNGVVVNYAYDKAGNLLSRTVANGGPAITSVNTAGGAADMAQDGWIEIKGTGLAPASVGPNGLVWSSAPEFAQGKMPTQLGGVSVTVNGQAAFIYFVSAAQINVLTPLDTATGPVQIVVNNGSGASVSYTATLHGVAPSFLHFGATSYIAATHAQGALLGPASLSVPGYTFTPAQPGETIVLYAVGFGLPTTSVVNGSATQSGVLPASPVITIGGVTANVQFAGIASPGLAQFNVIVPSTAGNGDNAVTATYGGLSVPAGSLIFVSKTGAVAVPAGR